MLKEIILINSANFDFARVTLNKDLFFLGDNGSGKTTFIRAIHFLYSGDIRSLGIPTDKESFKDYYFKYDNSYIIYVFKEFFIFVYKRSNELYKHFSKQRFELEKIIDSKKNLLDFKEIRNYIKSAFNVKVAGVNEYSDIIYGKNRKYLDFKIADIHNKELFLKLFNAVFNVDKAIIDAKSIKKALLTSLDFKEDSKFFDPNEYLFYINAFLQSYNFFSLLEKNAKNIQKVKELKQQILFIEQQILQIGAFLNYKKDKEKELFYKTKEKIEQNKKIINKFEYQLKIKEKIKERFKEKIENKIAQLKISLKQIDEYEKKFSPSNIQNQKEIILKENFIKNELDNVVNELAKLKMGLEDEIKSIDNEIKRVEYTISMQLRVEKETKFKDKSNSIKEIFAQKKEKIVTDLEYAIEKIENEIKKENEKKESLSQLLMHNIQEYKKEQENFINILEKIEQEKNEIKNLFFIEQEKLEKNVQELNLQNYRILKEIEDIKSQFQYKRVQKEEIFLKEKKELLKEKNIYEKMIKTKPNSFKEFLEEEVEKWQEILYPILDESILSMDKDLLKPKLLHKEILGIEYDATHLKKILPFDEAKAKIERINKKLQALKEEYDNVLLQLREEEKNLLFQKELKIQEQNKKIALMQKEKEQKKKELEEKIEYFNKEKKKIKEEKEFFEKEFKINQEKIKEQIQVIQEKSNKKKDEIKKLYQQKNIKITNLNTQLQKELTKIKKELTFYYEKEKTRLQEYIKQLQEKKKTITKNKRLIELEKRQKELQKEQSLIIEAKLFLKEFEKVKEEIAKKEQLKITLKRCNDFKKLFLSFLQNKIKKIKKDLEFLKDENKQLNEAIKKYAEGLEKIKEIEIFSNKVIESEQLLIDLIKQYKELLTNHKEKIIELKDILSRLNRIRGLNQYEIYFDIALFDKEHFLQNLNNILLNIENLEELYDVKIEQLKKQEHTRFENFVKNIITQKLSLLSNTQDKFISLVVKVNKKLKEVDFGVIKEIKLDTKFNEADSIAKMLRDLKELLDDIAVVFQKDSLFFDRKDAFGLLKNIEELFIKIKKELKSDKISLTDTIELTLSFYENGLLKKNITQIKNESSTGGSMLLKIALAISILKVFIKDAKNVFYLIVDEVSRLHSHNQKRLKDFANSSGFRIIFVTPEPVFANTKELQYYKFIKSGDGFEVIELNR